MKKIEKIASFISGIILSVQPLVSAMSPDSKASLFIINPDGKTMEFIIDDEEQKEIYSDAFLQMRSISKMSKMQRRLRVRALAKSIVARNLSFDTINKLMDDFFGVDSNDPVFSPFSIAAPLLFDDIVANISSVECKIKTKTSVENILKCECTGGKQNQKLNLIFEKSDENFTYFLCVVFDYLDVCTALLQQ